ncbi:MAG: peptidoglycan -binding protein [Rhodovibrionaceae bacterium]
MYSLNRTGRTRTTDIWPGFVDGLASLLLVVIFVLMVFMVAQFFLSVALTGRDEQLTRLNQQIEQLSNLLALERSANQELRSNVNELSSQLQASLNQQDDLSSQLAALTTERDVLEGSLTGVSQELENAYKTIEADKAKIEAQLQELAILKSLRDDLRKELEQTQDFVVDQQRQTESALARVEEAEAALSEARDARRLAAERAEEAERELGRIEDLRLLSEQRAEQAEQERDQALSRAEQAERSAAAAESERQATQDALIKQENLTEEAQLRIDLLNRQILALREQLAQISAALEASEEKNREQEVKIADLGKRLNVALATRVQELARYRSEFFGRLREVLGDNPNIRIVGDRFVFQSELFFAQGEAELGADGKEQLRQLAETLKEIGAEIPDDIDWLLRVDGHTDKVPISNAQYPSNWELSTARAVSVVKFLNQQGIPAERLAAAGFGEFQPLDSGETPETYRRNRRIEIKFDQQ